jgi:hypothetical protein
VRLEAGLPEATPIAPMPMTMEVRRSERQMTLVVMTMTGHMGPQAAPSRSTPA